MGGSCSGGEFKPITVCVVGDTGVGKSTMICDYWTNHVKETGGSDDATINMQDAMDPVIVPLYFNGEQYSITIIDTYSSVEGNEIRALSLTSADVVIICFAINEKVSFQNVKNKYLAEVKKYAKSGCPVIICGTKLDLRPGNPDPAYVSTNEGNSLTKELNLDGYIECSTKSSGISEVIRLSADEARKFLNPPRLLDSFSSRLL